MATFAIKTTDGIQIFAGNFASYAQCVTAAIAGGGILINADFGGQDLTGVNWGGSNITGADFSGANCSGCIFTGATLAGANFQCCNLSGADFRGTLALYSQGFQFLNCNLSGIKLDADWYVRFATPPNGSAGLYPQNGFQGST